MLAFVPLLGLAAAGGFVALSYEIFFFRTVTDATGSGAFGFAATLGAFLLGLAFGEGLSHPRKMYARRCASQ